MNDWWAMDETPPQPGDVEHNSSGTMFAIIGRAFGKAVSVYIAEVGTTLNHFIKMLQESKSPSTQSLNKPNRYKHDKPCDIQYGPWIESWPEPRPLKDQRLNRQSRIYHRR